jgi:hypothetical protein
MDNGSVLPDQEKLIRATEFYEGCLNPYVILSDSEESLLDLNPSSLSFSVTLIHIFKPSYKSLRSRP